MKKLYVGVDWHKRTSTWVAIDEHRNQVYQRSWGCTPPEVHAAISSLPAPPGEVTLAVEPVCGWRWMSAICTQQGIDTRIANPKRLREIAQTAKKNDKNDALTMAELLRMNYLPEAYRAPEDIHRLRVLVRQRSFFVRVGTATKCRIHGICTAIGAHHTSEKPLHKAGRMALSHGDNRELRTMFAFMDESATHQRAAESDILMNIKDRAVYRIISSMPGIGPVTGAAILAEVGDFARFPSPSHLISYAGLYPKERSSAGVQHFGGMSKVGSRILRYSIVEAAMRIRDVAGSHNLYSHYAAALTRGKTPKQARVVIAHKMLTILWYLVRNQTTYDDRAVRSAQREMTS